MKKPYITNKRNVSGLIRIALADENSVAKSKDYRMDMHTWHKPNGKCSVCFAGAVMAKTLGCGKGEFFSPDCFPDLVRDQLLALNRIREGYVFSALHALNIRKPDSVPYSVRVPAYSKMNRRKFRREMFKIARMLEAVGL